VSGVTSIGRVQPEVVDWAAVVVGGAAAGAEVAAGAALPGMDELPAHAIATNATTRLIGTNRRTIILPSRFRYAIVARTSVVRI
jgi:hypothetical protein